MIDFHTHLDLYPNPIHIAECVNARNMFTLCVTTSPRAWLGTSRVFKRYENIIVGLGLHPEIAAVKINELEQMLAYLLEVKYVGEIGMDGLPQNRATLAIQKAVFTSIVKECAKQNGKIMSIHSRGAVNDVLTILRSNPGAGIPVLHWFSGTKDELRMANDQGCYFSVNPLMLNSTRGVSLIAEMPRDRVLPESDGPFARWRGIPLQPFVAEEVAFGLSRIWRMPSNVILDGFKHTLNKLTVLRF